MIDLRKLIEFSPSDDRIYHYTSTAVALEHILGNRSLRFNSVRNTNDPREFEYWAALATADGDHDEKDFDRLATVAPQVIDNIKRICKIACFSVDSDSSASNYSDIFDKGYCLPRMWSQYADNHTGVCLVFSRKKLLAHIESDVKSFYLPEGETFTTFANSVRYDNDTWKIMEATTFDLRKDKGKTDEQLMMERIDPLLFNKYKDYEHEHEFRIALYSKYFESKDSIRVGYGNALEAVIFGARAKSAYRPSFEKLAKELDASLFELTWLNGRPEIGYY